MHGVSVINHFFQHINVYSDVSALSPLIVVSLIHIHVRVSLAEDCYHHNELYSNVKKTTESFKPKTLDICTDTGLNTLITLFWLPYF